LVVLVAGTIVLVAGTVGLPDDSGEGALVVAGESEEDHCQDQVLGDAHAVEPANDAEQLPQLAQNAPACHVHLSLVHWSARTAPAVRRTVREGAAAGAHVM